MRKLFLALVFASAALAATPENFYEMKHPVMPDPVPPQQLTFPALSTNNTFTGFNAFQGTSFALPLQLGLQNCPVSTPSTGIDLLYVCGSDLNFYYQDSTGRVVGPLGSGGGGGGATISTNGVNNTNQTLLNFQNSVSNVTGLALTFSNPSSGNELAEISGTIGTNNGGSGRNSPTANAVLLGEGSAPFNTLLPGPAGTCLISNGPGVDPNYQACPGGSGSSNYPLTIGNGVSGGVPYFSSTTTQSASAVLVGGQFVMGGGAGNPPITSFSVAPAANGGTGVGAPTAHQVPIAEGSSPFTFITPGTSGWCLLSNGTGADPSFGACPTASPAGATDAIQYNAGGGAFGGLASPTSNGVYNVIYNVTANAAVVPTTALPGVPTNPQTGTSYTYGSAFTNADRFGYTTFSNASTVTVTLPQAGTTGFTSNWGNISCNIGVGQVNIVPTTSNISYTTFQTYVSGASSMPLTTGQCAWIFSNNTNYFALVQGGVTSIVKGTATLGTSSIASGACAATVTAAATGITTANVIDWGLSGDISGITGFAPSASGGLYIEAFPTVNNVNFKVCNNTANPITPGSAVVLNWSVRTP